MVKRMKMIVLPLCVCMLSLYGCTSINSSDGNSKNKSPVDDLAGSSWVFKYLAYKDIEKIEVPPKGSLNIRISFSARPGARNDSTYQAKYMFEGQGPLNEFMADYAYTHKSNSSYSVTIDDFSTSWKLHANKDIADFEATLFGVLSRVSMFEVYHNTTLDRDILTISSEGSNERLVFAREGSKI